MTDLIGGFNVILGDAWMNAHAACLDYRTKQCIITHGNRRMGLPCAHRDTPDPETDPVAYCMRMLHLHACISKEIPVNSLVTTAKRARRAIRKGCRWFVMQGTFSYEDHKAQQYVGNRMCEPKCCNIERDNAQTTNAIDSSLMHPDKLQEILREFADVFPDELPPGLPPDRGVEVAIPLALSLCKSHCEVCICL